MGINIIEPGLLTTVQDSGRTGYQKYGFPSSGALDQRALATANLLVSNDFGEAALEMTMQGATIAFTRPNVIALSGCDMDASLNGRAVSMHTAIAVKPGDILTCGFAKNGCRCYLAFAGGLAVPHIMGSKSTNLKCGIGGYLGRRLAAGDVLSFSAPAAMLPNLDRRTISYQAPTAGKKTLRVIPGPQENSFTKEGAAAFFGGVYTVTNQSDRMGCRLDGPKVTSVNGVDILSDGIPLGAIQITSAGQPIILLADRQTVGGYAKIGVVISIDLPVLAQCKAGDQLCFTRIGITEAQELHRLEQETLCGFKKTMARLGVADRPAARRISELLSDARGKNSSGTTGW